MSDNSKAGCGGDRCLMKSLQLRDSPALPMSLPCNARNLAAVVNLVVGIPASCNGAQEALRDAKTLDDLL